MATCLLVYVPSLPLQVDDLMPQEELALAAGYLRQAGHLAHILDLGTPKESAPVRQEARGLLWLRKHITAAEPHVDTFVSCINNAIYSSTGGFDLVAFLVRNRDGLVISTKVNTALQANQEPLRTVCFGPYAERFAPYISAYNPAFDTVVAEEPGTVLACLVDSPELGWGGIPGLMVRERGGSVYTGRVKRANHTAPRPLPDYSERAYPQLHSGEKIHYFAIRNSAARSAITPSLMARARHIRSQFGSVPLHFEHAVAEPAQIDALSNGVAKLDVGGACSLTAPVRAMATLDPASLERLRCRAMSMEIFSGSQRLLDDFFRAGFTVTEMEAALRGARAGGALVHAKLTYPCPWDDRHTEAETLRILERNRPEGTTAHLPELVPGTPWFADPDRYGFRLRHRRLARFAAGADSASEAPAERGLLEKLSDLGLHHGVGVHELLCASAMKTHESAGGRAASLGQCVSGGDVRAVRAFIDEFNGCISEAAALEPLHRRRVRAAMGN